MVRGRFSLKIMDLISAFDRGNYSCVVSNVYGTLRHTFILDVVGEILLCLHIHTHTRTYTNTHTHTHTYTHTHTRARAVTCTQDTHTQIHIRTHTHTHTPQGIAENPYAPLPQLYCFEHRNGSYYIKKTITKREPVEREPVEHELLLKLCSATT